MKLTRRQLRKIIRESIEERSEESKIADMLLGKSSQSVATGFALGEILGMLSIVNEKIGKDFIMYDFEITYEMYNALVDVSIMLGVNDNYGSTGRRMLPSSFYPAFRKPSEGMYASLKFTVDRE
tara:strand:+ start:897 stop:1268 length:372 start_codon:yes stop_codon:yes gene_type:complete